NALTGIFDISFRLVIRWLQPIQTARPQSIPTRTAPRPWLRALPSKGPTSHRPLFEYKESLIIYFPDGLVIQQIESVSEMALNILTRDERFSIKRFIHRTTTTHATVADKHKLSRKVSF